MGVARFLAHYVWELLTSLPALLRLRRKYRRRVRAAEPQVACVGDNLDEVNGIALSSRIMVQKLRSLGKPAFLFGVAFHTRQPRVEGPDGCVILAPGRFSVDQAGYAASEVAALRMDHFIRFLETHPIDVIEIQTPGPVSVQCLIGARIAGIKTLSHYRTDILTYSRLLVDNRFGVWFINTWTELITRWAGPVVVPSLAYREKVAAMGAPLDRIHKLPRGVDLENFHPDRAANGAWGALGLPEKGVKLLYVGRVSAEKNLALLAEAFTALAPRHPDLSLTVVGDGPMRPELQRRLNGKGRVHFTGVLEGDKLAGVFAAADIFVFPSLTDTFGNSVIEALASGIPCVTSDLGGPREIIVDGECGLIFDSGRPEDMGEKILALASDPEKLRTFKSRARERALQFTYDHAAGAFWDFYCRYHRNQL